jgi:hypothetical protein
MSRVVGTRPREPPGRHRFSRAGPANGGSVERARCRQPLRRPCFPALRAAFAVGGDATFAVVAMIFRSVVRCASDCSRASAGQRVRHLVALASESGSRSSVHCQDDTVVKETLAARSDKTYRRTSGPPDRRRSRNATGPLDRNRTCIPRLGGVCTIHCATRSRGRIVAVDRRCRQFGDVTAAGSDIGRPPARRPDRAISAQSRWPDAAVADGESARRNGASHPLRRDPAVAQAFPNGLRGVESRAAAASTCPCRRR